MGQISLHLGGSAAQADNITPSAVKPAADKVSGANLFMLVAAGKLGEPLQKTTSAHMKVLQLLGAMQVALEP